MRRRRVLLIVILLALAALLAWAVWANGALTLTRVTLSSEEIPEGFRGFKIAHVSDLHNAVFGEGTVIDADMDRQAYVVQFDAMDTARMISFRVKLEAL